MNDNVIVHTKTEAQFNDDLHTGFVKKADALPAREVQLAQAVKDARAYLDSSVHTFQADWMDWLHLSKKSLEDMRLFRMAMASEVRHVQQSVKDLRDVLDANRDTLTQATQVIDAIERLHKLESSGFLSRLETTLLKLL